MTKDKLKTLLLLHIMLMIYSMSGICSKMASKKELLSVKFCPFSACIIGLLRFYAIECKQLIKRLPLTTAFANKAITIVWGLIWGLVFFQEPITVGKVIGVILVVAGVVLYAKADGEEENNG